MTETLAVAAERLLTVYENVLAYWESETVLRPESRTSPTDALRHAVNLFTHSGERDDAWSDRFDRPEPKYGREEDGQRRLLFDPGENEGYLAAHRANLAKLKKELSALQSAEANSA